MISLLKVLRRFALHAAGATAIEYSLYAMGISLAILPAVQNIGTKSKGTYTTIGNALVTPAYVVPTATMTAAPAGGAMYAAPGVNTTFVSGAGADAMHGNTGRDRASYSAASAGVYISIPAGIRTGDAYGDTYDSVEELEGSSYNDTLDAGTSGMSLVGAGGNDTLTGRDLNGGIGTDMLMGMAGGNNVYRFQIGDGQDQISAGNGSTDRIIFGPGVTPGNISFIVVGTRLDLYYGTTDKIRIQSAFQSQYRIETIEFSDGTTMAVPY